MSQEAHIGQILPLKNEVRPVGNTTTFYASYDKDLWGYNAQGVVKTVGHRYAADLLSNSGLDVDAWASNNFYANPITFECWIKPNTLSPAAGKTMIVNTAMFQTPYVNMFGLGISASKWAISIQASDTNDTGTPPVTPVTTSWTHLALTMNAGVASLYVNGILSYSKNYTSYTLQQLPTLSPFDGSINEIRMWGEARSQTQILSNMYKELVGNETNLLGYFKANEGYGTLLHNTCYTGNDSVAGGNYVQGMAGASQNTTDSKFGNSVSVQEPYPALRYPQTVLNDAAGTISFWAKLQADPSTWTTSSQNGFYFVYNENYTSNDSLKVKNGIGLCRYNKSTTTLSLIVGDSASVVWQKNIPFAADTNWHHYAVTWDKTANLIGIYLDGIQVVYESPTVWWVTLQNAPFFCLGSWYMESGFNGCANLLLDEVRIDKVAIKADEILSWYYANGPFLPHRTSELAY